MNREVFIFTLVDLPMVNPYDWIVLLNIVARDPVKHEHIFQIL